MRILFCTSTFEHVNHGPAKFANFLLELNKSRPEVDLHILTEDISMPTKTVHKLSLGWLFLLFRPIGFVYRVWPFYIHCKELHNKYHFDVIWHNNVVMGTLCAMWIKNVPHIGMINDNSSMIFSSKHYGFWEYVRRLVFRKIERRADTHYQKIVVNSKFLYGESKRWYKFTDDKLAILYKAVDFKSFGKIDNHRPLLSKKSQLNIMFLKADYLRGGLDILIEALTDIERNFELSIVGPDQGVLKWLKKKEASNISFKYLGRLSQHEVRDLIKRMDIFCTPSRKEALGVANMEALMLGLPVVYSDVGGVPEVMNFGENGFTSNEGDVISLRNAIVRCIEKDQERVEKSRRGFAFMDKTFNKEEMLTNFIEISRNVAKRR